MKGLWRRGCSSNHPVGNTRRAQGAYDEILDLPGVVEAGQSFSGRDVRTIGRHGNLISNPKHAFLRGREV